VVLALIPVTFGIAALVIGRGWVVALAAAVWVGIAVFLIANDGWYGHGWGEFGVAWNAIVAALTLSAAASGVLIRKGIARGSTIQS
jgi:hypothetical protein